MFINNVVGYLCFFFKYVLQEAEDYKYREIWCKCYYDISDVNIEIGY